MRLVFSLKSETERKECGGIKQAKEKAEKNDKGKVQKKYHVPDRLQPQLSDCARLL